MPYVPIGLWFRLISRMITLTANKAFQALLDISEPAIRKCWRKGIFVFWSKVYVCAFYTVPYSFESNLSFNTTKFSFYFKNHNVMNMSS